MRNVCFCSKVFIVLEGRSRKLMSFVLISWTVPVPSVSFPSLLTYIILWFTILQFNLFRNYLVILFFLALLVMDSSIIHCTWREARIKRAMIKYYILKIVSNQNSSRLLDRGLCLMMHTCQLSHLRCDCHASEPMFTLARLTRWMSYHLEIRRPKFIHKNFFNAVFIICYIEVNTFYKNCPKNTSQNKCFATLKMRKL